MPLVAIKMPAAKARAGRISIFSISSTSCSAHEFKQSSQSGQKTAADWRTGVILVVQNKQLWNNVLFLIRRPMLRCGKLHAA
jgi:hypothetical protein